MKFRKLSACTLTLPLLLALLSGCAVSSSDRCEPASDTVSASVSESVSEPALESFSESVSDAVFETETEEAEDKNVQIARGLLTESEQVRERMAQGMTLLYTGDRLIIEGRNCMIFALGTNHGDQFVRECLYGVCDNLIYAYDAVADTWIALGTVQS